MLEPILVGGFGYSSQNGVGLVWMHFSTFIFNYCKLIDNPTSCINKTQATTIWSSFIINMLVSPNILDLDFPYKWLDNEVRHMFQCLFTFFNEVVPFSTICMASSNVLLVHLLLIIRWLHLLTLLCFLIDPCLEDGETFFLSWLGWSYNPLHLLCTFNIMI
jgi:hypothetical protein